jgi:hypothetical protein
VRNAFMMKRLLGQPAPDVRANSLPPDLFA